MLRERFGEDFGDMFDFQLEARGVAEVEGAAGILAPQATRHPLQRARSARNVGVRIDAVCCNCSHPSLNLPSPLSVENKRAKRCG
jgi:hypothetical protein